MPASRFTGPASPPRRGRQPAAVFGVPLIGLLVAGLPMAAAAVVGALVVAIVAVVSPWAFVGLAALLSTAVPKAGVVVGGFPVPVMMFVLLLAALTLRSGADAPAVQRRSGRLCVLALVWLAYRLVVLRLDGGELVDALALAGWYGLPIVLLLVGPALGALRGEAGARWAGRLEAGLLLACGFSIVQQLWGIERTALPGVTRAVGADYSAKPLGFAGGSKIPSTYQNGNIFGVVTAFFFLIAADRVLSGRGRPRDRLIMAATGVASLLSGSRTILIGLALGMAVLVARSRLSRRTVVVSVAGALALAGMLQLAPALADRLLGTKASDPALAVRTHVWNAVLDSTSVPELVTGGPVWAQRRLDPGLAEGLVGAVQQVGLVGVGLFVAAVWAATGPAHLRRWRIMLIPVAISFLVDSAYLVFPTLFIPLARMFAPLAADAEEPPEEQVKATTERRSPLAV